MALSPIRFSSADRSLFDTLLVPLPVPENGSEQGYGKSREDQVRVFVKQLLTALQYMHHRNIAHLDLRPEVVLLQVKITININKKDFFYKSLNF